jgi:ankyrin repeat protein
MNYPSLSVDSRDSKGNTMLMYAAKSGNFFIVDMLLKKGANLNLSNVRLHIINLVINFNSL